MCEREERELLFTTTIRNKNSTERESFKREKERNTMEGKEKKPRERGRDF